MHHTVSIEPVTRDRGDAQRTAAQRLAADPLDSGTVASFGRLLAGSDDERRRLACFTIGRSGGR